MYFTKWWMARIALGVSLSLGAVVSHAEKLDSAGVSAWADIFRRLDDGQAWLEVWTSSPGSEHKHRLYQVQENVFARGSFEHCRVRSPYSSDSLHAVTYAVSSFDNIAHPSVFGTFVQDVYISLFEEVGSDTAFVTYIPTRDILFPNESWTNDSTLPMWLGRPQIDLLGPSKVPCLRVSCKISSAGNRGGSGKTAQGFWIWESDSRSFRAIDRLEAARDSWGSALDLNFETKILAADFDKDGSIEFGVRRTYDLPTESGHCSWEDSAWTLVSLADNKLMAISTMQSDGTCRNSRHTIPTLVFELCEPESEPTGKAQTSSEIVGQTIMTGRARRYPARRWLPFEIDGLEATIWIDKDSLVMRAHLPSTISTGSDFPNGRPARSMALWLDTASTIDTPEQVAGANRLLILLNKPVPASHASIRLFRLQGKGPNTKITEVEAVSMGLMLRDDVLPTFSIPLVALNLNRGAVPRREVGFAVEVFEFDELLEDLTVEPISAFPIGVNRTNPQTWGTLVVADGILRLHGQ